MSTLIQNRPPDVVHQSPSPRIYAGVPFTHVSPVYIIQGEDTRELPPDPTYTGGITGYAWDGYCPHSILLAASILKDAVGGVDDENMCLDFTLSLLSKIQGRRFRIPLTLIEEWHKSYRDYLEAHG